METVKFSQLKDCDAEDVELLERKSLEYSYGTSERTLELLESLGDSSGGLKVTRLEHSLQSATRAWWDGADIDWIVSALLHDIGDLYAPFNHDEYAALILKPFVRQQCSQTVQLHGEFQKYYYNEKIGKNRHVRDRHRENIYFDDCVEFCENWDQSCFDPSYEYLPTDFFRPFVHTVFSRPAFNPKFIQPGKRVPLSDSTKALERQSQ